MIYEIVYLVSVNFQNQTTKTVVIVETQTKTINEIDDYHATRKEENNVQSVEL